tara:strand:- start:5186 stop:5359 length:174 start_codon:yes stop_codon:yes gene_type:complete
MNTGLEILGYMLGGLFVLCATLFLSFIVWIAYMELRIWMRTARPIQGGWVDDDDDDD